MGAERVVQSRKGRLRPRSYGYVAVVLAVGLVVMLQAPPAGASQPIMFSFDFEYSFVDPGLCEFPVVLSTVASATVWYFFDAQGNLVRATVKVTDISAATNPANQTSISGKNNWINTIYPTTSEQTVVGLFLHLNVPGAGVIIRDAGRIRLGPPPDYEVTFEAGTHEAYFEGDTEALCAALS